MADSATATRVQPVPAGYYTVTPSLVVHDAAAAIAFYQRAFGAEEVGQRAMAPDGQKVWHAEIQIGSSRIMLNDEFPDMGSTVSPKTLGGTTATLHLYVEDADAFFQRAVEAGATVTMPLENTFWGDRFGGIRDPFGHEWAIATHIEDLTQEEMYARLAAMTQNQD